MEKVHTYDADASEKYVCPNIVCAGQGTPRMRDRQLETMKLMKEEFPRKCY